MGNSVQECLPYILNDDGLCYYFSSLPQRPYVHLKANICNIYCYDIILPELSIFFSVTLWLVTLTITMSSDVTDVWQYDCDVTTNPNPKFKDMKVNQKRNKKEILNKKTSIQDFQLWHTSFFVSCDYVTVMTMPSY